MHNTFPKPQELTHHRSFMDPSRRRFMDPSRRRYLIFSRRRWQTPILVSIVLALVLCMAPYGLPATPRSAHAATVASIPQQVPANAVAARVTRVVDGDTIRVRINGVTYKVRYIGMDTPERGDPCYKAASDLNAAYVAGQTVYLEKDVREVDRYGRLLRYVWTADGVLVNVALVRRGYALAYTFPPDVKYETQILAAQRSARNNNAGCLWDN